MRNENTFGVQFLLRINKESKGRFPVYARITINGSRTELAIKHYLQKEDWNAEKGLAYPRTKDLKLLNTHLEEIRGKFAHHYREIQMQDGDLDADTVKAAFLGLGSEKKSCTLLWLINHHNEQMKDILEPGTLKNYRTTELYLKNYLQSRGKKKDLDIRHLNYEFISSFEPYIRSHPIKQYDYCTNNGTMKHLERLKKIISWAVKNEWIVKNPFVNYKLRFVKKDRGFLDETELAAIEKKSFENPMLQRIKELFVFSCYTGLAYIDLIRLRPDHIIKMSDGSKWISTSRAKTNTEVNVPILSKALGILEKYINSPSSINRKSVFPYMSNQEMNRGLKLIAEICEIRKYLSFHLARHTFATTVTLLNGVPIESISKMLGHTKITTTMVYARVSKSKLRIDMESLENTLKEKGERDLLKIHW